MATYVAAAAAFVCLAALCVADSEGPQPWPLQFHCILVQSFQGELALIDLWYDWPNGRNFNIIHNQLGSTTYDLEWTNGTSFFYDLQEKTCRTVHVPVGILRPNWLEGAQYLGTEELHGFNCTKWQKLDFIVYWEDIKTKRPVRWIFYTGRVVDVMTFDEGAVLEDSEWQAPAYCFKESVPNQIVLPGRCEPEERWLNGFRTLARNEH